MRETEALQVISALAHQTRLRVLVLLTEAGDVGMTSGAIADAADVPRNLMSAHLALLGKAGVVSARKSGRNVTYVVDPRQLVRLGTFLQSLHAAASIPTAKGG